MRFSPLSFVLGLAAASLVPVLSRVFRPLAVEATAQARREQLDAETHATATDEASAEATVEDEAAPTGRVRRRTNGARRRAS